jgi:predicted transposase YdaD
MHLPKPLESEFWQEILAYEEERKMPYITSLERMGYDRGRNQGREEGREEIILNLLRQNLPLEVVAQVSGRSIAELQCLQDKLRESN